MWNTSTPPATNTTDTIHPPISLIPSAPPSPVAPPVTATTATVTVPPPNPALPHAPLPLPSTNPAHTPAKSQEPKLPQMTFKPNYKLPWCEMGEK